MPCPLCHNKIAVEDGAKMGPYARKHTAFCGLCGILYVEKKPESFKLFRDKPPNEKAPEPVLVEETKPLPMVFRKPELITS